MAEGLVPPSLALLAIATGNGGCLLSQTTRPYKTEERMNVNIHNFNGHSLVSHQSVHNPALLNLLEQFFHSGALRNQQLGRLLAQLEREADGSVKGYLLSELSILEQKGELQADILNKLLP